MRETPNLATMQLYLYLSLIPEALIFSQLPPDRFGKYLAIGDKKLTKGPAVFFEVDPALKSDALPLERARKKCEPHLDGSPRRSTYVSVYHALANIPTSALGDLHLATKDGVTLRIQRKDEGAPARKGLFLYQELCPVSPSVASPLGPAGFCKYVTNPESPAYLPRMVFCDQRLDGLSSDPENAPSNNLPYPNVNHLRECLTSLKVKSDKMTKIVHRDLNAALLFYMVDTGFYVGDQDSFHVYPMPSEETLEKDHYSWLSSAQSSPLL